VSREQLRELRGQKGFDTDALNEALAEHMDGNWKPETWEPIVAAGNTYFQQNMPNGRFVILKRWGMLSGRDLKDAGMSISADRLEEQVMAQVWVVGNRIIRLSISDELHRNRIPVYLPRFMVSPLTLAGVGLPEMMFDSQDAVNACERAKMDNMAQICRPNVTIRTAFLDLRDPTEAIEFKAGKIWLVKETELPNPPENPVQFWVPANALPQISQVQNESLMLAEEQTGLPRFLQGQNSEGTHNRTFGGASLQFDRAVTPFKTFIFNFEHDCTAPLIASFGRFYQLFSNDPQIKGDFKVLTKGVQGLMAREVLMQRLTDGLQAIGNNSMLASSMAIKVDPAKVWDMVLQGTGLSHKDIFNTPQGQQILEQKQAQAQAQQQQFAMQQQTAPKQRAETPPKDAWIEFMKEAPDGSQSKYAFMLEAAKQWGFMTPDVNEALRHDMQVSGLQDIDNAHQAGVNQAEREMGPHEQHALDLQQQQVKGAIQSQLAQQQAAAPGGPNAG